MSYDLTVVTQAISGDDRIAWGQLRATSDLGEHEMQPSLRILLDKLLPRFPQSSPYEEDGKIPPAWKSPRLADDFHFGRAELNINMSRANEVVPFVLRCAQDLSLTVFDWPASHIHRGNGLLDLVLNVESKPTLYAPSLKDIDSALDALISDREVGFIILERPGKDYVQIAGKVDYVFEWHDYMLSSHWVAGHGIEPSGKTTRIATAGSFVTVNEDETMSEEDLAILIDAYLKSKRSQTEYQWRQTIFEKSN